MKHRPRKQFGQNFLQDKQIIAGILAAIDVEKTDKVVEIGPGLGALTHGLLQTLNDLTAIEIDTDLQAHLSSEKSFDGRLNLLCQDALTVDYSQWGKGLRVVGNLPYNISTPLLFRLISYLPWIKDMHFMLQKEVVERLAARPSTGAYGRLSILAQYYLEVDPLIEVPPAAFYPAPKVDSTFVRLTPYLSSPYESVAFERLQSVVTQAFSMRRKTLRNNFKRLLNDEHFSKLGIDPSRRPEELTIQDYVNISHFFS
ncbi:MAG: 16S rRNA (adenine(1518)-N(6)/adenine(1519)-N(6))-dimethyltransferase RsmA [Legionella sp.]|nr:16S rRNA (adenine(1518)-N(6)/adenine(1519)-N(6))-dimethyltransferase RsmA [Legionella sp.]